MINNFMNPKKGFAPIVIILAVVILLGVGAGGFVLVSKNKTSSFPSPSPSNQIPKIETPSSTAENPRELLGWWEEVESWSLDFNTGQLKKDSQAFPFQREFTDTYFCTQYSAKFTCANNIIYSVSGNKISLEGSSNFYEWRIIDGRLELTSKDSKGRVFGKALHKNIGPPTSTGKITAPAITREGMAESPKPNLKFVKVGEGGICLAHEGGDSISYVQLGIKIDDQTAGFISLQQFPVFVDYIFDAGEFFVFAVQSPASFKVGSKVEMVDTQSGQIIGGPWVIEKVVRESAPVLIGGLASCP